MSSAAHILARTITDNARTGTRKAGCFGAIHCVPIGGEPAGGDEEMDVRMIEQGARPRMEDRETAEGRAHIPGIACERVERRRGALHQRP